MLEKAVIITEEVARHGVEDVILFHSASGKDSIALLDILAPRFKRVVCVFMYVVKNLRHVNRYISYATAKYPNCEFVQIPHFAVFSYVKYGYMGHKRNEGVKLQSMSSLTELVREKYKIEWAFYGFKQSDSLNRRCMLRSYRRELGNYDMEAINYESKKCYPLSHYKNGDVLEYIERSGLIRPEVFSEGVQSSGQDISDIGYLKYLRERFPSDLKKVCAEFPNCERLLFEYDYKQRHGNDKEKGTCGI